MFNAWQFPQGANMIKKHYYTWNDVENMCVQIVKNMYADNWTPDYIVGIHVVVMCPQLLLVT